MISPSQSSAVEWVGGSLYNRGQQPLTWYKVRARPGTCNRSWILSFSLKEPKIFAGLLRCTERNWAIGIGPEKYGKGSSLDQWAKHRKILDGICEGQLWCLQVFWNLPSPKMPAWLWSTNSKMVQLQECL